LAVAAISLSGSTLSPFPGAYQSLPVKYPQLDYRMDILLVHETLAPLPLITKPQVSLLIEVLFGTTELGLLVPLSSSLLPSQVGWVTLHQFSYLKTEAHDDEERKLHAHTFFRYARLLRFGRGVQGPHRPYVDLLTSTLDGFFVMEAKTFLSCHDYSPNFTWWIIRRMPRSV
jgi:hypothetical protein